MTQEGRGCFLYVCERWKNEREGMREIVTEGKC